MADRANGLDVPMIRIHGSDNEQLLRAIMWAEGQYLAALRKAKIARTKVRDDGQMLTHNGRTLSIAQWAIETGIIESTIRKRLHAGATPEQALAPVHPGKKAAA